MKPKLSLSARMWQRVTAYANQSTIHGEYIFHTFNLEPVSIFLLLKNFQEYLTCYLATSSAESSGWLLFLLLPQAIGYDFFFTLLHISKFEAYLFRGGNYSFGSITGSLKYVILRSQRSLLSTPGAAYFSLSIFADWKAVRTVTSLSSAVSRQACSSHHQIVIWIWQTQSIYK